MNIRIRPESLLPAAPEHLLGHQFAVTREEDTFKALGTTFVHVIVRVVDEPAALAFLQEKTGAEDIVILTEGVARPLDILPWRLNVELDSNGVITKAYYG